MNNKRIIATLLITVIGFVGAQARFDQAEIYQANRNARIANYQSGFQQGTLSPSELQKYRIDLQWAIHNMKAEINTLRYTKRVEGLSLKNQQKLSMLQGQLPNLQAQLQELLAVIG